MVFRHILFVSLSPKHPKRKPSLVDGFSFWHFNKAPVYDIVISRLGLPTERAQLVVSARTLTV